ncbi:MAG: fibronectin type III domain-containing protein, partial [Betaproteobacteria bacterium]
MAAGGKAVTTFHAAGLYWTPTSNPGSTGCIVQYKQSTDSTWRQGFNLWYDSRNNECRGSIVDLTPGTSYDFQMGVGSTYAVQTSASTWNEQFPIAKTITVGSQSTTLNVTESGSASGYVLYQAAPGAV